MGTRRGRRRRRPRVPRRWARRRARRRAEPAAGQDRGGARRVGSRPGRTPTCARARTWSSPGATWPERTPRTRPPRCGSTPARAVAQLDALYALDVHDLDVVAEDGAIARHKIVVVVDGTWSEGPGAPASAVVVPQSGGLAADRARGDRQRRRRRRAPARGRPVADRPRARVRDRTRHAAEPASSAAPSSTRPGSWPAASPRWCRASPSSTRPAAASPRTTPRRSGPRAPPTWPPWRRPVASGTPRTWCAARSCTGRARGSATAAGSCCSTWPSATASSCSGSCGGTRRPARTRSPRTSGSPGSAQADLNRRVAEYALRTVTWDFTDRSAIAAGVDRLDPVLLADRTTPVESRRGRPGPLPGARRVRPVRLRLHHRAARARTRGAGHPRARAGPRRRRRRRPELRVRRDARRTSPVQPRDGEPRRAGPAHAARGRARGVPGGRRHPDRATTRTARPTGTATSPATRTSSGCRARPSPTTRPDPATLGGHRHPNGGGFVDDTATVDPTAYVGPDAVVRGDAQVLGDARIEGRAWVEAGAVVEGGAVVRDVAIVRSGARLSGTTRRGRGRRRRTSRATSGQLPVVRPRALVRRSSGAAGRQRRRHTRSPRPTCCSPDVPGSRRRRPSRRRDRDAAATPTPTPTPTTPPELSRRRTTPSSPEPHRGRRRAPGADARERLLRRRTRSPTTGPRTARTGSRREVVVTGGRHRGRGVGRLLAAARRGSRSPAVWNARLGTSGSTATAENMSYNGSLRDGATTTFGFQGTGPGDAGLLVPQVSCTRTRRRPARSPAPPARRPRRRRGARGRRAAPGRRPCGRPPGRAGTTTSR